MAALPAMLEHDRTPAGWSVEQAARRLGVSVREYRAIEAGERSPAWETWDRICMLFGWGQSCHGNGGRSEPEPGKRHRRAEPVVIDVQHLRKP